MSFSNLRQRTTSGIGWSGASLVVRQISGICIMAVLARILVPADFGLVTMASVYISVLQTFSEMGFSAAIVHKKNLTEQDISTCFWATLVFGLLLFVISIPFSHVVSLLFKQPLLVNIVIWSSFCFVLYPFIAIQNALIYKKLLFKKLAFIESAQVICGGLTSILLALKGYSVYSIVFGNLVGVLVAIILFWFAGQWRPSFVFSKDSFFKMSNFGMKMVGLNFLGIVREKIDYLVIGRVLGPSSLGSYTIAFNLMDTFRSKLLSVIIRVLFPSFSEIQDDSKKLKNVYLEIQKVVGVIAFPVLSGIACISDELIPFVYGDRWDEAIVPLKILAAGAIVFALTAVFSPLIRAVGKPEIELRSQIFAVLVLVVSVCTGYRAGIIGVSAAVSFYSVFYFVLVLFNMNKYFNICIIEQLVVLKGAFFSTVVMVCGLTLFKYFNAEYLKMSGLFYMFASALLGVIIYVVMLYLFDKTIISNASNCIHLKLSAWRN